MKVIKRVAVPVSCKSEASVTKVEGREAAEVALAATDELPDCGIDVFYCEVASGHQALMSMSAQQNGPKTQAIQDLLTKEAVATLCSAGILTSMRANISGLRSSHFPHSSLALYIFLAISLSLFLE